MRCPICDYDTDLPLNLQSPFFAGLSIDIDPSPFEDEVGTVKCSCFSYDGQDDLTEGFEIDEET